MFGKKQDVGERDISCIELDLAIADRRLRIPKESLTATQLGTQAALGKKKGGRVSTVLLAVKIRAVGEPAVIKVPFQIVLNYLGG